MNENDLGRRLARRLDPVVEDLDPRIAGRLAAAREQALARVRERASGAIVADRTGAAALGLGATGRRQTPRLLLPVLVLVAGLIAIYAWQANRNGPDPEENEIIDLLSDDLPLSAYTDQGFHQWISPALQR